MAKQTEYAILVEPLTDADGGGWLASVPALPGCMGDGETREAALADVQNAIAEWKDAAREGVSLNAFVTSVLAEAVGKKTV